jgi:hypothetical protein
MTAAQKTAKEKFKKAIAYRQKTGVSLKEAFAHIYGKKVGAVKKKAAPKKNSINLFSKIGDIEKNGGTILGVKIGIKKILGKNKLYDLKIFDVNKNKSIINLYPEDKISDIKNNLTPKLYQYIFNTTTESYTVNQSNLIKNKLFTYLKLLLEELKRLNKKPIKKATPIKKAAKKVVKKAAPKKKAVKKVVRKVAKKVIRKKLTNQAYDRRFQALKPGKRTSASGNTYYEYRANRSDRGKLLGIKKYNYEQLDNIRLTRVNNDNNGNPRYVVHFLDFLNNEENSFLPFSKKYEYALKKAKIIGGRKFDNKQFGGGVVFQSYNTDNLKEQIIDVMETTPKIKY